MLSAKLLNDMVAAIPIDHTFYSTDDDASCPYTMRVSLAAAMSQFDMAPLIFPGANVTADELEARVSTELVPLFTQTLNCGLAFGRDPDAAHGSQAVDMLAALVWAHGLIEIPPENRAALLFDRTLNRICEGTACSNPSPHPAPTPGLTSSPNVDPCRRYLCVLQCTGSCGWSDGVCVTGGFTSEEQLQSREGCLVQTTSLPSALPASSGGSLDPDSGLDPGAIAATSIAVIAVFVLSLVAAHLHGQQVGRRLSDSSQHDQTSGVSLDNNDAAGAHLSTI